MRQWFFYAPFQLLILLINDLNRLKINYFTFCCLLTVIGYLASSVFLYSFCQLLGRVDNLNQLDDLKKEAKELTLAILCWSFYLLKFLLIYLSISTFLFGIALFEFQVVKFVHFVSLFPTFSLLILHRNRWRLNRYVSSRKDMTFISVFFSIKSFCCKTYAYLSPFLKVKIFSELTKFPITSKKFHQQTWVYIDNPHFSFWAHSL